MTKHKIIHTGDKPYTCKECLRSFSRKYDLFSHKKYKHGQNTTDEKFFQCDSCDRRCRTSGNLKVHKRIHTGEKPFQCPLCDKRFYSSGEVTKHKIIHTQDKPYPCKVCLRSFSRKCVLMKHNKSQHLKIHTEKLFQCDSCDRRCRRVNNGRSLYGL